MAARPSIDEIALFKTITSLPSDELAVKFIQGAGNNVEHAINNYFENPGRYDQVRERRFLIQPEMLIFYSNLKVMMNLPFLMIAMARMTAIQSLVCGKGMDSPRSSN
jgi:hypothetical protein